jgi:hypothetical protein
MFSTFARFLATLAVLPERGLTFVLGCAPFGLQRIASAPRSVQATHGCRVSVSARCSSPLSSQTLAVLSAPRSKSLLPLSTSCAQHGAQADLPTASRLALRWATALVVLLSTLARFLATLAVLHERGLTSVLGCAPFGLQRTASVPRSVQAAHGYRVSVSARCSSPLSTQTLAVLSAPRSKSLLPLPTSCAQHGAQADLPTASRLALR